MNVIEKALGSLLGHLIDTAADMARRRLADTQPDPVPVNIVADNAASVVSKAPVKTSDTTDTANSDDDHARRFIQTDLATNITSTYNPNF